MDNKIVSIAGFILVLIGLVATVCVFAFEDGIRRLGWIDLEVAALGSMVLCVVGAIFGWLSVRTLLGKIAGILGTMLVIFYFVILMMDSEPHDNGPEKDPYLQDPPGIRRTASQPKDEENP